MRWDWGKCIITHLLLANCDLVDTIIQWHIHPVDHGERWNSLTEKVSCLTSCGVGMAWHALAKYCCHSLPVCKVVRCELELPLRMTKSVLTFCWDWTKINEIILQTMLPCYSLPNFHGETAYCNHHSCRITYKLFVTRLSTYQVYDYFNITYPLLCIESDLPTERIQHSTHSKLFKTMIPKFKAE